MVFHDPRRMIGQWHFNDGQAVKVVSVLLRNFINSLSHDTLYCEVLINYSNLRIDSLEA